MTTVERLLRAVLEEPHADDLRLILADALDEAGQGERAEFVRVQCRMENARRHCGCGSCVRLRGGGQHTNGPCGIDQERDELPGGRSRQAFLRLREKKLFALAADAAMQSDRPLWGSDAAGRVVGWSPNLLHCDQPDCRMTFRRGLVESVSLPLAAFLGGECRRCADRLPPLPRGRVPWRDCPDCHGSGRVGGHAAALFAAAPITRVTLTDREPFSHSGERYGWWLWRGNDRQAAQDTLPDALWRQLTGHDVYHGRAPQLVKWYESIEQALIALSDACVSLGRSLAGLPPLRAPEVVTP